MLVKGGIILMFINFSNHKSDEWSEKQLKAAKEYGDKVIDISFPEISPSATEEDVTLISEEYVDKILSKITDKSMDAVMVQGEFTLSFMVTKKLLDKDIRVVSACSERVSKECVDKDGKVRKEIIFDFVKFRNYGK